MSRALWLFVVCACAVAQQSKSVYADDVTFAVKELETTCAALLKSKAIDWRKATEPLVKESKKVSTTEDHARLLIRLVARLRDGHAEVRPTEKTKDLKLDAPERAGPGFFLCRNGGTVLVKNPRAVDGVGGDELKPGLQVVSIGGKPAAAWLEAKARELADTVAFSTDHHAFFYACHQGLAAPPGTRLELELKDLKGRVSKRTITCGSRSFVPDGPAFPVKEPGGDKDVRFVKTAKGNAYVHVRRCPSDLPERMDQALAAVGAAPGLVLDLRGNSGGGFDHDAFMGRFVPKGTTLAFGKTYASAGGRPFVGPVVVIVDATVRSAGETLAAIMKEDGRAYVIGESATAGMSATKKDLALPSGLFVLHVAVGSNMGRANGGKGIEGIGVPPHEIVAYEAKDLDAGVDTLLRVAEERLAKFPQDKVPYMEKR